jgi:hypothetical protein
MPHASSAGLIATGFAVAGGSAGVAAGFFLSSLPFGFCCSFLGGAPCWANASEDAKGTASPRLSARREARAERPVKVLLVIIRSSRKLAPLRVRIDVHPRALDVVTAEAHH